MCRYCIELQLVDQYVLSESHYEGLGRGFKTDKFILVSSK